ncbi:hypothetical protein [Escherichia phage vB_EcoM_JNE01]|nr:hypothetical protein [Escherichia phage vB_EcoM_JNE01]
MLSFREQLAKGNFAAQAQTKIPKKSAFLGTITEDGYCDFNAPEDTWYIEKDTKRSSRLHKSTVARKQRKELKRIRFGEE